MNVLPLIDQKTDQWYVPYNKNLAPLYFDFTVFPNEWFKRTIKDITLQSFKIGRLSVATLARYHQGIRSFFEFILELDIPLDTFADLTPEIAEEYLYWLLFKVKSPSTRAVRVASLKYHLKFGVLMDWDGFPSTQVFDGTEGRVLQNEDTLKSRVIDDRVMEQIEVALEEMATDEMSIDDTLTWGLIKITKATGMRLHEALAVKTEHISKDLTGKPILEVINEKTLTDRYIPISNEVVDTIHRVDAATKPIQQALGINLIFVRELVGKSAKNLSGIEIYSQYTARAHLSKFLSRFNIVIPETNELESITFHQFRHTIGTDLINNGMTLLEVMEYLGHDSSHSTRLYAKIRNDRFDKAYRDLGFLGVIADDVGHIVDSQEQVISHDQRLMAQLPDGVCAKPIKENVIDCKKPNACLFCPKFITTPEFLDFHKDHLARIRADKERYMQENLIGTDYLLNETEKALEEIISQLEDVLSVKGDA